MVVVLVEAVVLVVIIFVVVVVVVEVFDNLSPIYLFVFQKPFETPFCPTGSL